MPETDAFDPTHALDGWRPPAPAGLPELALDALLRAGSKQAPPPLISPEPGGFDPTHLLDGWRPPAPAPLDLELRALLRAGSAPDEAKMARLKARGYEMRDVEDIELAEPARRRVAVIEADVQTSPPAPLPVEASVDVPLPDEASWPAFTEEAQIVEAAPAASTDVEAPVLDFHVAPPPDPDPQSLVADIELPQVAPPPAVVEMPELDMAALTPRWPEPDPRLLAHWQAGAWTALARQVGGASEELLQTASGPQVDSHAPQWLCAIWPPQPSEMPLGRWPELAALVAAETTAAALQQLLAELPGEARL